MTKSSLLLISILAISIFSITNFSSSFTDLDNPFNSNMKSPINPNVIEENSFNKSYNDIDGFVDMNPSEIVSTVPVTEPIETSSITSENHSPGRDSYIIDFGFQQLYTFSETQTVRDGFTGHLSFTETATFAAQLTIPVNLTLEYDTSATAGSEHNVIASLYPVPFGAGLTISYGFTLGGAYRIGPFGSIKQFELYNYSSAYVSPSLTTPMDPEPLDEYEIPLPLYLIPAIGTAIDALFDISLVLTPQLDVDISADLYYDGDGFPSVSTLNFGSYETQAFAIAIDELSEERNNVNFGLRNFNMDFFLSLLWSLRAQFGGLLSFLNFFGPLTIDLFTYPRIPLGGILTAGDAYGTISVTPSTNLPQFGLDSYELVGDVNGIAEPGETITVNYHVINYGSGASVQTNLTVTSLDVSLPVIDVSTTNPILPGVLSDSGLTFGIPGGYTGRNVTINFNYEWLSPNGTLGANAFNLTLRVLQPGEAFLNIDSYSFTELTDGFWDAGESIMLNINISKIGTANIDFGYIEVLDTDPTGFSSTKSWDSTAGAFTTWNSSNIDIQAPVDISQERVDLYIWISYDLTTGETFNDFWVISYDIFPQQPYEDLVGIYGTLVDGIDDSIFSAGENFTVTAEIENFGTDDSGLVYGILVTNDTDVVVENSLLTWSDHTAGSGPVISSNNIQMSISPHAENQTVELILYIIYQTWWGELIVDEFIVTLDIVQQKDPKLTLNYYDIFDVDTLLSSTLTPGQTSFVTVNIGIDDGPAFNVIGQLRTDNPNVVVMVNDTSGYGNLDPGLTSDGDGFVVHIPTNFAGGTVRFYVNVTSYSAVGGIVFEEEYFDVVIAAGDVIDPTYNLVYPQIADNGSLQSMTITIDDDTNVANMYFAYFDYDLNDWEIYEVMWTGDVGGVDGALDVIIDFQMDANNFLFALLIFDHAGNYVGSGLDTPNVVIVNFPITIVSTDSGGTTTPTTPTQSDTQDIETSNGDSSPIFWMTIIIGFGVLMYFRRRK